MIKNILTKETSDKYGKLVRLSCDIAELRQGMLRTFRIKIDDFLFENMGYLIFEYCREGKIFISDLKSFNKRQGHGKLMHDFLLEILPDIEDLALSQNLYKNKISYIEGELFPSDGSTRNELILFYRNLGYEVDNNSNWIKLHWNK